MAVLDIVRMGNPLLRLEAEPLTNEEIADKEALSQLVDNLCDSMEHYGGIGIAAPQVGISKQICIIEIDSDQEKYETEEEELEVDLMVIINPVITIKPDAQTTGNWEGCLSVPGLRGYVERPDHINLEYTDENGERIDTEIQGFLAVVVQHELDHLFGKLYVDHIKDTTMFSYEAEFKQFISEEEDDEENDEDELEDQESEETT